MDEKLDQKLMPLNFKVSDLSTKLDDAMQCNAMQCNAMQCNAMQCNAMQCNAILNMHIKW
jgi:hypothetical protein